MRYRSRGRRSFRSRGRRRGRRSFRRGGPQRIGIRM